MDSQDARNRDPGPEGASTTPLHAALVERIELRGPLTFAAFMETALYHPEHGYYGTSRSPWGREGDYLTAPQVSDALGRCVARLLSEADAALERPTPLDLVEVGSGDGALLEAVLAEVGGDGSSLRDRLRAWSVERGGASRGRQRRRFGDRGGPRIVEGLEELPEDGVVGLVYSNELFDAFPVHRVRVDPEDGLQEAWVGLGPEGALEAQWGPPSTPRLREHLEAVGAELRPGQVAEVCLEVRPWYRRLARRWARGYLLTVDYGHSTAALYDPAENPAGTLAAMHRYRIHRDYLARPGRQDLTAHVDLGLLRLAATETGLESDESCSLGVFLLGFGAADGAGLGESDDPREHLALRHLLFSEIADRHRALLQRKAAPPIAWARHRL